MADRSCFLTSPKINLLRHGAFGFLSVFMLTWSHLCLTSQASQKLEKRQAGVPANAQNPQVFQALDQLRGNDALSATQIQQVLAASYPGSSYPTYSYIPQTSFSCNQVRQFGFYADPETRCQVFRRCEANNFMFSYICPNGTVCDWFFNVNCPSTGGFFDYSNPRIYRQDLKLFDDYYGYGGSGGGGYGSGGGGGYGYAMSGSGPVPSVSDSGATSNMSPAAPSISNTASANTAISSGAVSGSQSSQQGGQYRRIAHKDSDTILI